MDDSISRQAAIDALKNRWKKTRNYEGNGDEIAEECELYLKQLPSAQSERKKGNEKCSNELPCGWCSLFDTPCFGRGGEQDE